MIGTTKVIGTTHVLTPTGSIPVPRELTQTGDIPVYIHQASSLYSRLSSKYLFLILTVALASLIEDHCRTYILLLFLIAFNPYHIYALF